MSASKGRSVKRFLRREQGATAVEFAILLPVFLLLVFGIIDFGHAWYIRQEVTSASRVGARYGAKYQTDGSGDHISPNALNPSIVDWVTTQYAGLLPANANLTVTPGGAGFTNGIPGADLSVTVTATKTWFVLGHLVPGFSSSTNITASTVMKVE